ncbi:MAG TPA: hypothetical protein VF455_00405 [Chryseobacterium sp.]
MKKIFLLAACALFSNSLFSQQWDGAINSTDHIFRNGNVSIGTSIINDRLNVATGNIRISYDHRGSSVIKNSLIFGNGQQEELDFYITKLINGFHIYPRYWQSGSYVTPQTFYISNSSKVGIGTFAVDCTNCSDYRLFVKDGIKTEKVKVEIAANNGWADYVFHKDYKLMPLNDLQSYIDEKGHLPEVPTTEEAIANGIELKEMNILLLKKVEELTLYLIDQDKINQNQKVELESNRREINDMKNKLNSLLSNQNNLSNNK